MGGTELQYHNLLTSTVAATTCDTAPNLLLLPEEKAIIIVIIYLFFFFTMGWPLVIVTSAMDGKKRLVCGSLVPFEVRGAGTSRQAEEEIESTIIRSDVSGQRELWARHAT